MKITEYSSIRNNPGVRRRTASGAGGTAFAGLLDMGGSAEESGHVSDVSAPATTFGVLALQEVDENETKRRQVMRHAGLTLESLEQLRSALLMGRLPLDVLKTLENRTAQQRNLTMDPDLLAILDDIELRAAVEVAKIETALALRQQHDTA